MAPHDGIKAKNMSVYISGLRGQHPIETGIAYYYRGHYLYGQHLNPIEPIGFATKKEIMVAGTTNDTAPEYDPEGTYLKPERAVGALHWSMMREWKEKMGREEMERQAEKQFGMQMGRMGGVRGGYSDEMGVMKPRERGARMVLDMEGRRGSEDRMFMGAAGEGKWASRRPSKEVNFADSPEVYEITPSHARIRFQPVTHLPPVNDPVPAYAPRLLNDPFGVGYTPHDRGMYLAASAPGSRNASRLNTPFPSRPASPPYGSRAFLCPIASTPQLNRLLVEEGINPSRPPLKELHTGWMDPNTMSTFVDRMSRPPSQASRPHSRQLSRTRSYESISSIDLGQPAYSTQESLPSVFSSESELVRTLGDKFQMHDLIADSGLAIDPTNKVAPLDMYPNIDRSNDRPSLYVTTTDLLRAPDGSASTRPVGTGRPRRASMALNEAYNAKNPVSPRAIHTLYRTIEPIPTNSREFGSIDVALNDNSPVCGENGNSKSYRKLTKCCLHGDACDGETTTNQHLTAQARAGRGFKDCYPTIECGGCVMIDWARLHLEEKEKMERESDKIL